MRRPIIAGNWKMNLSLEEAKTFIAHLEGRIVSREVEPVLCSPFTILKDLKEFVGGTGVKVGAQNMHFAEKGAYTGEISASMLRELGTDYVIIGHSERRQYFNETSENVRKKAAKALENSLVPIICCGETLSQREAGETQAVIGSQIRIAREGINENDLPAVVIAYEPIWAIGTGKVASSEQAESAVAYLRSVVVEMFNVDLAHKVRILYGGSVTPENIEDLMNQPNIDGALVGGASLKPENFLDLINYGD